MYRLVSGQVLNVSINVPKRLLHVINKVGLLFALFKGIEKK